MTASKDPQIATDPLPMGVTPARSCGPLGYNDAGDPNALVCMPGDTQGPLGSGYDSADPGAAYATNSCQMEIPVLAVDLEKMRRMLYAVAYAEAADEAATRWIGSWNVDLGDQKKVEASASIRADKLTDELLTAMASGPEAVQSFIEVQEARKQRAAASLKGKLEKARQAGKDWEEVAGTAIRFCAGVKFISTVTVKTVGIFTGWVGTGIDFAYSEATDLLNPTEAPRGVVAEGLEMLGEGGKQGLQQLAGKINELVAEGIMTETEKNKVNGWLGNYKGNAKKIKEQLDKIEKRLLRQMEKGRSVANIRADRVRKLAKLRKLRVATTGKLLASAGAYKKAAGKVISIVFLAQEVNKAWEQLEKEYALSHR